MKASAHIDAGVCGFHTTSVAKTEDGVFVSFEITSDCDNIRALAKALETQGPINAYEEISPAGGSVVMRTVQASLTACCAGCAVPPGIFKSMQVAAGLALPKDITIQIRRE